QPSVSLTDNNPDEEGNDREIINGADLVDGQLVGEPEKATVTGYLERVLKHSTRSLLLDSGCGRQQSDGHRCGRERLYLW
ncbi:hypothetical protein, partial [Vibrio breoganii]|uniref:hypothetical protein n=1 Tax=Vibrio breoganii TaxID=553239 RepID=UPI0039B0DF0E